MLAERNISIVLEIRAATLAREGYDPNYRSQTVEARPIQTMVQNPLAVKLLTVI